MKTLVIVNHRETAKAFADYACDFAKINQGDTLKIIAVLDLPYGWNAGLDRIVVDTDVALQWVKNLERYIPCARGWTTTKAIIENGAENDELFDLAIALYLLEHGVAPPQK